MGEKIKKLLGILFSNKKVLFLTLGVVLFFSLAPLHLARANIFSDIFGAITNIGAVLTFGLPLALVTGILYLIAMVGAILSAVLVEIMKGVIQGLMQVPVIVGEGGLEVTKIGWEFSRDFVNMLFILILVFIGLATILRLQTYQAQKTLPLLIIIALLVNFSAVIVGFVVDLGNIITNFFISNLGGLDLAFGSIKNMAEGLGSSLLGIVTNITQMGAVFVPAIKGAFYAIFFLLLTVSLFGVMFLFLMRAGMLLVLTILSPLAFAAYILPSTRAWWTKWWQQLIQWSIIGIPIAFFLLLAQKIATTAEDITAQWHIPVFESGIEKVIGELMVPFLAVLFIIVGFLLSIQMAPAGAQGIMNFSKSIPGKLAATRAGQKALGGLAGRTAKALGQPRERIETLKRAGIAPSRGSRIAAWMSRPLERAAAPALIKYSAEREKMSLPKDFEKWTAEKQEDWANAKRLDQNDLLVAGAKMGGNLEYTSKDFNDRVTAARDAVYGIKAGEEYDTDTDEGKKKLLATKENMAYMDEAKAISKVFPGVSEAVRIKTKIAGKTGYSRESALKEIKKDIEDTAGFIKNNLSEDDLAIEAGLKLKYITKEEVDIDRARAVADAKVRLTTKETEQFLKDTAAGATYVREFKGGDIGKIADVKNLATRTGIILGNPANLQRVVDEHGKAALDDVIKGPGGLDDATRNLDKTKNFRNRSPKMYKGIFTNPALRYIDIEARNQMRDVYDKPTTNFDVAERRFRMDEKLDANAALGTFYDEVRTVEKEIEANETVKSGVERLWRDAKRRKSASEIKTHKDELDKWKNEIEKKEDEIKGKVAGLNPALSKEWGEIEQLRGKK